MDIGELFFGGNDFDTAVTVTKVDQLPAGATALLSIPYADMVMYEGYNRESKRMDLGAYVSLRILCDGHQSVWGKNTHLIRRSIRP